jgi:serine/threonine protein kinase
VEVVRDIARALAYLHENGVVHRDVKPGNIMVDRGGTADADRRLYHLHASLKLREQVLNGAIIAISLPGQRMGNALSHWAELKRQGNEE